MMPIPLKQSIRFTTDAGGLERMLRLLQALAQILAASTAVAEEAKVWLHLRMQFALGRRYFRFFKFLDCWAVAYDARPAWDGSALLGTLEFGKWSCMGLYLFLESCTILDAMGVWTSAWASTCLVTANKYWFYALAFSILRAVLEIFVIEPRTPKAIESLQAAKKDDEKLRRVDIEKRERVRRRLVADSFDLLIPGSVTGWIPTSPATVGYATVISTLLTAKDIWDKLQ